mmetsp:Transcript_55155/g.175436  ORF Transcript_55155/g.175436 Transcript_55155/m.175436 type:complete len:261 (-) Transcript_55155:744-1526(-)
MGGTGFLRALLLALLAAVHTDASHLPPTSWASVEGPPGVAAHFQSPTEWLEYLYRKHRVAVQEMREYVRGWADETGLHQGVGDIEAEVIYLRIRELRPENVAEYGFGQGLTTVYILCALRDNGKGTLHSFDKLDKHGRVDKVPAGLAASRWVFHLGDARSTSPLLGVDFDYIHSDAQHSVQFAQWLAAHDLAKRTELHVSFHDAFVKEGLLHAGAKGSGGVTPEAMVRTRCRAGLRRLPSHTPGAALSPSRCGAAVHTPL